MNDMEKFYARIGRYTTALILMFFPFITGVLVMAIQSGEIALTSTQYIFALLFFIASDVVVIITLAAIIELGLEN